MSTEHQSPTNESAESANLHDSGADVGAGLTTDDLASYLSTTDFVTKIGNEATQGGRKIPLFDEEPSGNKNPEDDIESDSSEEELDLDLLDGDSEHTNASDDSEGDDEPTFEIQVDGKKFEVKQSELIADAQKYRAATTKFRDAEKLHISASEMRKEADEIKELYSQERNTLKDLMAQYQNFIEESYKQHQPDWEGLYQNDPLEYFKQKEYWQAKIDTANQAKAYRDQIRQQEEAELKVKQAEHLKAQQAKVFELFPNWKNPEVAKKAAARIETYLEQEGFSAEERNGLVDARLLSVAHKAAMYDQLVKANDQRKSNSKTSGKTLNAGTATTGDPGYAKRQAQTQAAREAKGWNDRFKSDPSVKTLEEYLFNQMTKKK